MTYVYRMYLELLKRISFFNGRNDLHFDPKFYRQYYHDLHRMESKSALRKHYRRYGINEGRFKNATEARLMLEKRFGALPLDFSTENYRVNNPDLASLFNYDWQFVIHYLEHGRNEGRNYEAPDGPARPWLALFRLSDFTVCAHTWLPRPPADKEEGVRFFELEGIDRLAPISLECIFDPAFYRLQYGFDIEITDVDLYKDWLTSGVARGRSPNESYALKNFVASRQYPSAFDWRTYILPRRLRRTLRTRLDALRHLFEEGFEAGLTSQVTGEGASDLFASIGEYHLIRGNYRVSLSAYDLAIATGSATFHAFHCRGDARRGAGQNALALSDYLAALSDPRHSIWSVVHAAKISAELGDFEKAFEVLSQAREKFAGRAEFCNLVPEIIDLYFKAKSNDAMARYDEDDRESGDIILREACDHVRDRWVEFEKRPRRLPPQPRGPVVILANRDIRQCTHYRVEQKLLLFEGADIPAVLFDQDKTEDFISALIGSRAAIFYRTAAFPSVIKAIMTANALGVPTYYEIDDLIFTPNYPDSFLSYGGQISRKTYSSLIFGVPLFRYAMAMCEHGIASTTPLRDEISRVVKSGRCVLLRNGLDERNEKSIAIGSAPRENREVVTIFYGSGTLAHNEDFNKLVGPAILSAFQKYNVRLVIAGHLKLSTAFARYSDFIKRIEFVSDLEQYWSLLHACDINLAPLSQSLVADCKSEIKWLEAAVLRVPSIVSGTATYREVLIDGVDALIADDESDWVDALHRLIVDRDLRRAIGAAARAKALRDFASERGIERLTHEFRPRSFEGHELNATRSRKLKVLVCNVYFPPQTHGGATRVVRDNIDYVNAYCDDIAVTVFATDQGIDAPGHLRLEQYDKNQVFRLSTPREINMDWRGFNAKNEPAFALVLDLVQPDIIHFHCVQRLTASIVEVAARRKIPYLVTIHDGWWFSDHQFLVDPEGVLRTPSPDAFDAVPPVGISLADSVVRRNRLASVLEGATQIITVSEPFADICRKAGCDNVMAIRNGVSSIAPFAREDVADRRLSLGHVGGRTVHKGGTLVEGIFRTEHFQNLKLTIVDMTMEPGKSTRTVWGNTPVTICAPCPQHEVARLYASLNVLLAPSIWPESFGLVTREAAAHGCWVVASNRGAVAEDIRHGENGFVVDVSDGRDLAAVLRSLDADIARFQIPPPKSATDPWTARDQGRELAHLYRKIAAQAKTAPSSAARRLG